MTNRRIIVAALVVVSTVALGAGLVAGERLPLVSNAWDSVAASLSSADPALLTVGDGGAGNGDAAAAHRQTAPLSSSQLGAPLVHGTFVSACGAPEDMKVVVKAAVKMGHVIDVTVKTDPPSSAVAACVERATRELQWDISPKVGRVTVTY